MSKSWSSSCEERGWERQLPAFREPLDEWVKTHSTYHVLLLQVSQLKVVIVTHLLEDIADRVADNL